MADRSPWAEQCPERGPGLQHVLWNRAANRDRCSECGANPDAPFPSLDNVPTVDAAIVDDAHAEQWEQHHAIARKHREAGFPDEATAHVKAAAILMIEIGA